jgi:hypothetical protein
VVGSSGVAVVVVVMVVVVVVVVVNIGARHESYMECRHD